MRLDNGSRMNREVQVRFWESLGVKSPWATHHHYGMTVPDPASL